MARKKKMFFIRWGETYLFFSIELNRRVIGILLFSVVIGGALIGLAAYGLKAIIRPIEEKKETDGRVAALQAENAFLRRRIEDLRSRMDVLYEKQKKLAAFVGIPVYFSSLKEVGVGGNLKYPELDKLDAHLRYGESLMDAVEKRTFDNEDRLRRLPSIPPVRGIPISGYGVRRDPLTGGLKFHEGIDYAAPEGTPIVATADGVVEKAGRSDAGYGIQVLIDHGDGIKTRYAHMMRALVRVGDTVKRGQVIGLVGNTGRSVGDHLHYEVLVNGQPVNPRRYILVDLNR
ncbi:MAG: M23 family metallopeptidase [Thermotogae bacterium]|nr:M23 family metallopeptidase [Thermotogota bacterium]